MNLDIAGVPMNITPQTVVISAIITFLIFIVHHFFHSLKKFAPFKGDKLANESLFFIFMVHKDYFNYYQRFHVENKEDFSRKLWQVASLYDIRRMQDEKYRNQFQSLLQKHHGYLNEAYHLFEALNHIPTLKRRDVDMVVKRTHELLNLMILDINEEFKDGFRPAA